MPGVTWLKQPKPDSSPCVVCGNGHNNNIILTAEHWHNGYAPVKVAICGQCQSAYTLNTEEAIAGYPSAEDALQDPNLLYLIYQYLEIASGLDWKLHLLERLPFETFNSVLEIGCNVGVTLDYCRTVWGADVVGLEPSAYGVLGSKLLDMPIINAYTHEAKELKDRKFDFIYATEVIEHVPKPLDFLREMKSYLKRDGILLITTPCSHALRKETPPGELYAILSPGAHYFLLSPEKLQLLANEAGYDFCHIELFGNTNIAVLSNLPVKLQPPPEINLRMAQYYNIKKDIPTDDPRVRLGYLLNYYFFLSKSGENFDETEIFSQLDDLLNEVFDISLHSPLALAEHVIYAKSIFDIGKSIPYSMPFFLNQLAQSRTDSGQSPLYYNELTALITAKGLSVDFQNLFLYHKLLDESLGKIQKAQPVDDDNGNVKIALMAIANNILESISELQKPVTTNSSSAEGRLRRLFRRWLSI